MKSLTKLLFYSFAISVFLLIRNVEIKPVWGEEIRPQESVLENNNDMTEETQKREEATQQQTLRGKEEKLEQELHLHQEGPRINQVPLLYDEYLGVDDDNNLPY